MADHEKDELVSTCNKTVKDPPTEDVKMVEKTTEKKTTPYRPMGNELADSSSVSVQQSLKDNKIREEELRYSRPSIEKFQEPILNSELCQPTQWTICNEQAELWYKLRNEYWRMQQLMLLFQSTCFNCGEYIASTMQGYVCQASPVDAYCPSNEAKIKSLMPSWGMSPARIKEHIKKWPPRACVKVSLKFLVHTGMSIHFGSVQESLLQEITILKKISSLSTCPNSICKYLAHWETQGAWGEYYLAMEYCECNWPDITKPMSLFEYVTEVLYPKGLEGFTQIHHHIRNFGLPTDTFWADNRRYSRLDKIRRIFCKLVATVEWLHAQKIAHLDISLENVMICGGTTDNPDIKLIDFGVAEDYSQKGSYIETKLAGKRAYLAPEIEDMKTLNKGYNPFAADVWTLGVCLWIMIFKSYPFETAPVFYYDSRIGKVMFTKKNGVSVQEAPLDKKAMIDSSNYLRNRMRDRQYLPMITKEVFDVLSHIFRPQGLRSSIKDLTRFSFCSKNRL